MKKISATIGIVISMLFVPNANSEESVILMQDDAPLKINEYRVAYKPPARSGDGTIVHRLNVSPNGKARIVSYGVGIRVFDSFKRNLGRPFIGYDMDISSVGKVMTPAGEQRVGSAYLFKRNGIGVAYIAIVRLEDGTIWKADSANVLRQLNDFELDLSSEEGK